MKQAGKRFDKFMDKLETSVPQVLPKIDEAERNELMSSGATKAMANKQPGGLEPSPKDDSIDRANKAATELNAKGYKIIEARDIVHAVPPEGYKSMEGQKVGEGDMRLICDTAGGTFRPILEGTDEGNYFKATKSANLQDTHYLKSAIQVTTDREARDNVKKVLTQQREGGGRGKGVVSNKAQAVGGGECCIFNDYGAGGCCNCNRGAGPELKIR